MARLSSTRDGFSFALANAPKFTPHTEPEQYHEVVRFL
jgi:hypothetical protein